MILIDKPLHLFGYRFEIDPYPCKWQKGFWIDREFEHDMICIGLHWGMLYIEPVSDERKAAWRKRAQDRCAASSKLKTTSEVAKMLGIHTNTLHKWVRNGKFPKPYPHPGREHRWLQCDVEAWRERTADKRNQ